jgi:iron complex transport system permease protein
LADTATIDRRGSRQTRAIAALGLVAVLSAIGFLTIGARGDWAFILPFRGAKLAAMCVVGIAIAVSTVLFQTITQNRILSPAIMGYDALYVAIQTVLVFALGARDLSSVDPNLRFFAECVMMVGASVLLFRWLLTEHGRSLHLLVLAGVVFGVMFRSVSAMLQRILDPNEFAVLQDMLFASFNSVDTAILWVTAVVVAAASAVAWRLARTMDVVALGRDTAIGLGVDHRRIVSLVLFVVAVLVSVSTALVGPITFFGLLVANLAYMLTGSHAHRVTLPAASLLAIIALVLGQTVLERGFGLDTALSIIIEFAGGILFIVLLLRGAYR